MAQDFTAFRKRQFHMVLDNVGRSDLYQNNFQNNLSVSEEERVGPTAILFSRVLCGCTKTGSVRSMHASPYAERDRRG